MKSFVYGGSKGIGLAIAKKLSKSDHIVYSISRNEPNDIKESDNINSLLKDINSFVPPQKLSDSLKKGPINKVTIEINKLKKSGSKIRAKGIKILKLVSKVNELVIQCIPLKK